MKLFMASNDFYNEMQAIIGTKLFFYFKFLTLKPKPQLPEPEIYSSRDHLRLISSADI